MVIYAQNNFKPSAPGDLNTFKKMVYTLKSGLKFVKSKSIIMILLAVTLFYGLSSEGYDRLSNAHFFKILHFLNLETLVQ